MDPRLARAAAVLIGGGILFPGFINLHDNPAWIVTLALVGAVLGGWGAWLFAAEGSKKTFERVSRVAIDKRPF